MKSKSSILLLGQIAAGISFFAGAVTTFEVLSILPHAEYYPSYVIPRMILSAVIIVLFGVWDLALVRKLRKRQKQTEQEEWAEQRRKAERRRRELLHQEALERQLFRARQERQADGREEPKGEDGQERSANEQ